MQSLIASFLIQHRTCTLPGIGTLEITEKAAEPDFLNKQISAPATQIVFSSVANSTEALISYIARKKQTGIREATMMLSDFCQRLKNAASFDIPAIGSFKKGPTGAVVFESATVPAHFALPVAADRVIHAEAEHHILVGDKETTNTAMTEYYTEEPIKKSNWWIWALVLGAITLAALIIHLSQSGFTLSSSGNIMHIH